MTCNETNTSDWFHMVGVYQNNAETKIYINGTLLVSDNTTISSTNVSSDFRLDSYLGASISEGVPSATEPEGANSFWNGQMDDFQLYEKALTDTEVLDLFNGQSEDINP